MDRHYVTRLWTDNGKLYAETDNGIIATCDLRKEFKGFRNATNPQINNFEISLDGIYWPDLDEDVNLESMFHDNNLCQLTSGEDSVVYRPAPESHDIVAGPNILASYSASEDTGKLARCLPNAAEYYPKYSCMRLERSVPVSAMLSLTSPF